MGRVRLFNGSTGLFPFTNDAEVPHEDLKPKLSRLVGQELMLLLLIMPPTFLRVESTTTTTAKLVWTDNALSTQIVELERALGDGAFSNIAKLSGGAGTFTDIDLAIATRYRYRLRIV